MLAAWLRLRFPHIFFAAYAASAPVCVQCAASQPEGIYAAASKSFAEADQSCPGLLRDALRASAALSPAQAAHAANLCSVPPSAEILTAALQAAFFSLAQYNYPYDAQLPAHPASRACAAAAEVANRDPSDGVAIALAAANVALGNATFEPCWNLSADALDYTPGFIAGPWAFERCTEVLLASAANASTPPFLPCTEFAPNCVNVSRFEAYCVAATGARPRPLLDNVAYPQTASTWLGGAATGAVDRVFFTNGDLDPWSYGGVSPLDTGSTATAGHNVYSVWMKGAAHHLDLRGPEAADPVDVKNAREAVTEALSMWLSQA
jgi:hypothetical protein